MNTFSYVYRVASKPQKAITRYGRGSGHVFYMDTPLTRLRANGRGNWTLSSEFLREKGDLSNLSFRVMQWTSQTDPFF